MSEGVVPQGLAFERVLDTDSVAKTVTVLAHLPDDPQTRAVVVLSKTAFTEAEARALVERPASLRITETVQRNDKFSKHRAEVADAALQPLALLQICPATPADVAKHTRQSRAIVRETAAAYAAVTAPWVAAHGASPQELAWVRNLVAETRPAGAFREEVLFEDADCVLCKDTKWDGADASELYCLAIVRDCHGARLRSVRDLRGAADADLLARIGDRCAAAIEARYGVRRTALRAYLHYVPSFWQLHVHFAAVGCPWQGENVAVGRAVLLDDAVDALRADPDHYARCSLTVALRENHPLYAPLLLATTAAAPL